MHVKFLTYSRYFKNSASVATQISHYVFHKLHTIKETWVLTLERPYQHLFIHPLTHASIHPPNLPSIHIFRTPPIHLTFTKPCVWC